MYLLPYSVHVGETGASLNKLLEKWDENIGLGLLDVPDRLWGYSGQSN